MAIQLNGHLFFGASSECAHMKSMVWKLAAYLTMAPLSLLGSRFATSQIFLFAFFQPHYVGQCAMDYAKSAAHKLALSLALLLFSLFGMSVGARIRR
jgi:hypothetical protein